MKRREWMQSIAAGAMAANLQGAGAQGAAVEAEIYRLKLKHTWTTTMSSSEYRDEIQMHFTSGGITAHGEGAPIVRYKEDAAEGKKAIESVAGYLKSADPMQYTKIMAEVNRRIQGQYAAKSAIDIALHDWIGKKLGVPLYKLFGVDPKDALVTDFSIGIDTPEMTKQKVREAEPFPVLKVKVGLDKDEATMEAIRSVTKKPLRVDANEGFKSKEEAIRKIRWLEGQGVELIEQPLPAAQLEEQRWVHKQVHLPIFADEACLHPSDIPKLADAYDGVVVKLDKSGGIQQVLEMIHTARAYGLKVMIGCMVSASVTITAAAHLSPLCDYADLDGNLLIANDPYRGVRVDRGRLLLPNSPGLGLVKV